MPDAPGIDAHQARLYAEAQRRTQDHVVRHALSVLEPGADVTPLTYREALDRLAAACLAEVQRLTALV